MSERSWTRWGGMSDAGSSVDDHKRGWEGAVKATNCTLSSLSLVLGDRLYVYEVAGP